MYIKSCMNTHIIVQNQLKSSIITHLIVHIVNCNYSYNCKNMLKSVI